MEIESVKSSNTATYQGSAPVEAKSVMPDFQIGNDTVTDNQNSTTQDETDEEAVSILQGKQIKNVVDDMNKKMKNSEAIFGIHDKTNRIVIKIVDKTTKEVIKEYPPEETLDMIAKVWEIAGILVDEKG